MPYWAQTHCPDLSNPVSLALKTKKAPLGATRSAKVNDQLKIVSTENSSNKGKNKVTKKPCGMILNILHTVKKT